MNTTFPCHRFSTPEKKGGGMVQVKDKMYTYWTGLPLPAPGVPLADQAHQKDTLFRVIPGSIRVHFRLRFT